MRFLFLAVFLVTAPAAAIAQQQGLDAGLAEGQEAYVAKLEQLTEAQRNELAEMDKKYSETLQPMLSAFDMGGKLLFCMRAKSAISTEHSRYLSAFKDYQAERVQEQEALWDVHRDLALDVDYIDHSLLDGHYAYIKAVQVAVARQTVDQHNKTGQYNKTDCSEVQRELDGAAKRARTSTPAGSTFDGTSGTLGNPQE